MKYYQSKGIIKMGTQLLKLDLVFLMWIDSPLKSITCSHSLWTYFRRSELMME